MNPKDTIDLLQALVFAVLQGVTELFPISSLGHAVVVPRLLGWNVDREAASFLPFVVTLHLGTALALVTYFRDDWRQLIGSLFVRSSDPKATENRRLLYLLVVGTVPAGIVGLLFEKPLAALFGNSRAVAIFLVANGALLVAGEWLRRQKHTSDLAGLGFASAALIGLSQVIALLPGFSRSGATMVGGLGVGLTHQAAARFGFLLSTPIIFAAAALEVPKLLRPELRPQLGTALIGGCVAGLVAYLATALLMRYFKTHEVNALFPFAAYCVALGIVVAAVG